MLLVKNPSLTLAKVALPSRRGLEDIYLLTFSLIRGDEEVIILISGFGEYMVYVLNIDSNPLMPCTSAKAKHLLKQGKAIVCKSVTKDIFVIQLTFALSNYKEAITLGMNAGSKTIGLSASSEEREYYSTEIEIRNDISSLLTSRRAQRRTRRNRLRYRPARFNNRRRNKGSLAPCVEHKVQSHLKAVERVCKILPISEICVDVASFDIQKINKPELQGIDYQQGDKLGFWNTREYVLFRDNHKCKACHGASKDKILNVHHIVLRKSGGSNRADNLITLCQSCHKAYHQGKITLDNNKVKSFKHETFMGIMRWTVYNRLKALYSNVKMTYGYITKNKRIEQGLEKAHRIDALCIADHASAKQKDDWLYQKETRCHNRQIHKANTLKGGKLKLNQAPHIIKGFKLWDKVVFANQICFISGRRTSGYFALKHLSRGILSDH